MILPLIKQHMINSPNAPAIIDHNQKVVTYRNLYDKILSIGNQLEHQKIEAHHRIGIVSNDNLELAQLFYGVSSVAIVAPLDYKLPIPQFLKLIDLLELDYIFFNPNLNIEIREALDTTRIKVLTIEDSYIGDKTDFKRSPDSTCLLLTTSGTTSISKIVPLTIGNLVTSAEEKVNAFAFTSDEQALITANLSRGTAINTMIAVHLGGGCALLSNGFNHLDFFAFFNRYPITFFTAGPAVLQSIVKYAKKNNIELSRSSLRFIRSSGAPLSENLSVSLENIFSAKIIQTYGMTETRTITTDFNAPKGKKQSSVGVSIGNQIKILSGEILVKGPNVFYGYENNPQANASAFVDGWFRTGDMGRLDEDGYLFITGRIKEMINRGGEKVSPYEIEEALASHLIVDEAVAFPIYNTHGQEDVAAAVVLNTNEDIDGLTLRSYLNGKIAAFKIPTVYYVTQEIPTSKNGKIQRKELHHHFKGQTPLKDTLYETDEVLTPMQSVVMRFYEKTLDKKGFSIHHDFYNLGGDSLLASLLHTELIEHFNQDIPVQAIFDYSNVADLSQYIASLDSEKKTLKYVIPLVEKGQRNPIFFVHSLSGEALGYYKIGTYLEADHPMYGIQFNFDPEWKYPLSMEQLATKYIEEILAVQPKGPYHFIGFCFGGVLAFEIAKRLVDRGEEVAFLGMIDSVLNSVKKSNTKMARSLADFKQFKLYQYPRLFLKKSRSFLRYMKVRIIVKSYQNNIYLFKNKAALLLQASKNYIPVPYPGPITYFKALDDTPLSDDSANMWKSIADDINIISLNFTHNTLSNPKNVGEVSKILKRELEKIYE